MILKRMRRIVTLLGAWALVLGALGAPAGHAMVHRPPSGGETEASETAYTVTLEGQTIGQGQRLVYETVDPALAGNPYAEDYYPGELTVELTGQIVIEEGGCLAIGTLSSGNDNERSPVLRGSLSSDGLIVVRAGGSLILKSVSLDPEGEGLFIIQEPGGSVALTNMGLEEDLIAWAPPTVDNTYQQPRDLWLEEGTALTEAMLPVAMGTYLQYQGTQRWINLALRWDMDAYDGRRSGDYTLTGTFLDEAGEALASVRPLTLTVHWYTPGQLIVTATTWLGQTAASANLELKELPEETESVCGEVSADGGKTWERWEEFQCQEEENFVSCVFSLPDSAPRHFRVRAANEEEHLYWVSEAVLLPKEETDPSDQGGNRGGSTAIVPSGRTPRPEATARPSAEPSPTATAVTTPAASPTVRPTPTPTPAASPSSAPPALPTTVLAAEPSPTPAVEPSAVATPEPSAKPPVEPTARPSAQAVSSAAPVLVPATPSATPEPTSEPTATAAPTPAPTPVPSPAAQTVSTPPLPVPEAPSTLPVVGQLLLVGSGVALCVLAGVVIARRKRK